MKTKSKTKTKSKSLEKYLKSNSKTRQLTSSEQKELQRLLKRQISLKAKEALSILLSYFTVNKVKSALDKAKKVFGKVPFYKLLKYTTLFLLPPAVLLDVVQHQGDIPNVIHEWHHNQYIAHNAVKDKIPLVEVLKSIKNLDTNQIASRILTANNLRDLRFLSEDVWDNITHYDKDQELTDKWHQALGHQGTWNKKAQNRINERSILEYEESVHKKISNGLPYGKDFIDRFYKDMNLNDIQQLEKPTWFGFDELKSFRK